MDTSTPPTQTPSRPESRRRRDLTGAELDGAAPARSWLAMLGYLRREFAQGDHVAIIGPTGSGKTHIALQVADLRSYVIGIACKPVDPLIEDARANGYRIMSTAELFDKGQIRIEYVDGTPLYPRIMFWPRERQRTLEQEKAMQAAAIRKLIKYVRDNGHWALLIDEGTWVCRDLNLQRDVDHALFQFRSLNSSIILLGQRPSWMGRYALSSPTHLFLFSTNDVNDRKALGEISGVDTKLVQDVVGRLNFPKHECLYINTRTREMFRTVAPAR